MPPTHVNGKICYLEIPTTDARGSAAFYERVFGWNVRQRSGGQLAFDEPVGDVSGTWVPGRTPADPGIVIYIMVDSVESSCDAIVANGGAIVQPIGADAPEITARFRDPSGNVFGLYQQPHPKPR